MATVNDPAASRDRTVEIFDNFYNFQTVVEANQYDVVSSFFIKVFGNNFAAKSFTQNLFRIAESTNIPALTLLDEIKDQNKVELSATFAYYLNNLRNNSTLLGIANTRRPAYYAARNVVQ